MANSTLNFVLGLSVGMVFAYISISYVLGPSSLTVPRMQQSVVITEKPYLPEQHEGFLTHEDLEKIQKIIKPIEFEDSHVHHDDDKEAKDLEKRVRVLCWIMTSPQNLQSKAIHVRKTWAHRCNTLLFMSSVTNSSFPTVGLNVSEGREHLTEKTMKAFRYIYEHHMDDADWFMKADDDTYVIVENLRYFLSGENPDNPVYFGHHFKTIVKQGYFSGGAGYVLSKEAMRRFGEKGSDPNICRQDGGAEDAEFGQCMERLDVKVGNSTDSLGRSRFHCFDAETHLYGGFPDWYYQYDALGGKQGKASMSDYAISFHYVPPPKMYALEYFVYHLRPFGIHSESMDLNDNN